MQLRKIAEVVLGEEKFDLARNGEGFYLVKNEDEDAYGHPVARLVDIESFVFATGSAVAVTILGIERVKALIDLVGELTERVQRQNDLAHAAGGGGGE